MKTVVDFKNIKDAKNLMRLNKYLALAGIVSRREADDLISQKKVHLNDKVAILGDKVKSGDKITINHELESLIYCIYNKKRGEETVFKIINKIRLEPIGRLDKESEGLLIYSNDYRIVEKLLNPKNEFEREYVVNIKEKATPRVKTILERGISTRESEYSPAKKVTVDEENKSTIRIVLTEGKKHEIRRMLNALNLTIMSLRRVRFLFLRLKDLKPGQMRELTLEEKTKLLKLLELN